MIRRRAGPSDVQVDQAGLLVTPFRVDFQTSAAPLSFIDLLPHAGSLQNTETAMREFYGYLYYKWIKQN